MRMPSILALALTSAGLLYRKIPGNALSTSLSSSARSDDKTVIFNAGGQASPGGRFLGLVSLGRLSTLSGRQLSAPASKLFPLPLVAASFSLSRRRQQSGSSTRQHHPCSSLLTFLRRRILSRNCLLFSQARCARHSRSALWVHSTRLLSSRVGGGRVISSGGICISGVVCRDMAGVVESCKTFSGTP